MGELVAMPQTELPERTRKFLKWTREIATIHRPNMAAFIVIAWDADGGTAICGDVKGDENPIPVYMLPSWFTEHVRAEFVTGSEVRGVLRDIGVLAPRPPEGA